MPVLILQIIYMPPQGNLLISHNCLYIEVELDDSCGISMSFSGSLWKLMAEVSKVFLGVTGTCGTENLKGISLKNHVIFLNINTSCARNAGVPLLGSEKCGLQSRADRTESLIVPRFFPRQEN